MQTSLLLGVIVGDILGSPYEGMGRDQIAYQQFDAGCHLTDDTILTIAVADAILSGESYTVSLQKWSRKYPLLMYGRGFKEWSQSTNPKPYNSYANGAAMRVAPIGIAGSSLRQVLREATKCAKITHNHPEGIKGAQAVAIAVYLAKQGKSKRSIAKYLQNKFKYRLDRDYKSILRIGSISLQAKDTVPAALISFFASENFLDGIEKAVRLGGDTDTLASITGGIGASYYKKIPADIIRKTLSMLPRDVQTIIKQFVGAIIDNSLKL